MRLILATMVAAGVVLTSNGCAAFRMSVEDRKPSESGPLSAEYDQQDLHSLSDQMVKSILTSFPEQNEVNPIVVQMGIDNNTTSHLDMKSLEDTIVTKFMDAKKLQFIDSSVRDKLLKEQGYQLSNCTAENRVKIGKQLGAKYMLTGALAEIKKESGREVRVSKKQDVYFQLTMKMVDLETGITKVQKQEERLRRASKPIIGW